MKLSPSDASALRDALVIMMPLEHRSTLDVIRACPEDMLGYRPHIKSMTFARMGFHIYGAGLWFLSLVGLEKPMAKEPSVPRTGAALVKSCESMHAKFMRAASKLTPEQCAAPHDFLGMGQFPAAWILNIHLRHLIHHRGQMQMMLRMMGAKCPAVYGPSGDVSFDEMVAASGKSKAKPRRK